MGHFCSGFTFQLAKVKNMSQYVVCALYKFVALEDYKAIRQPLTDVMEANQIKGTLLLAAEGINGTVSGTQQGIDNLLAWLNSDERFNPISYKIFPRHTAVLPD